MRDGALVVEFRPIADAARLEAARLLEKGVMRCRQGESHKAVGILKRVIDLDPADTWAMNSLGGIATERGDLSSAQDWLRQVLQLSYRCWLSASTHSLTSPGPR